MEPIKHQPPEASAEKAEKQERIVTGLQLGRLEEAPFVSNLIVNSVAGIVDKTVLAGGDLIYAPVASGETEVFKKTMLTTPNSKIPYKVCDLQEAGGLRKVLGISPGGGKSVVLGTESQPDGNRYLVLTDNSGDFVRGALLGASTTPDGKKTQKVLLVTSYKDQFGDNLNAISVADLRLPKDEETRAQDLKTDVRVTGLYPVRSEDNQAMSLITYNRGGDFFIGLVDSEGELSQQQVATDLYPLFVTGGVNNSILAVTRSGIVRGNIKTEAGKETEVVFQKLTIPPNFCRVYPAGEDKLLLVGKEGTVSLVDSETGRSIAQATHDELTKVPPELLIHTYEALPTGPNEWTIFVNIRDRNGTKQEGKSFTVTAR